MNNVVKSVVTNTSELYSKDLETIIIGAGPAGLSTSYYLKRFGIEHIVIERGKIGESWRSQRWDSFVLNTPMSISSLPGDEHPAGQILFYSGSDFLSSLQKYALRFQLPVHEHTEVIALEKQEESGMFKVTVNTQGVKKTYTSRQVIVSSGKQSEKKIPPFAGNISTDIMQIHAADYRSPSQLPAGAVLVVGSAQSGCQIAEDLASHGREVILSTSMVPRIPRRYRGRDIMDWLLNMKFFDVRAEDVTDPVLLHMKPPQLTGIGGGKHTISLQSLARQNVTLAGKMRDAEGGKLFFEDNAGVHMQFADAFSHQVKEMINEFIERNRLTAPLPDMDHNDMPDPSCIPSISAIDLDEKDIRSIIWATGFTTNLKYIKLPVFDNEGGLKHKNGMSTISGLYFLGFPWLRTRKSALINGITEDAAFIAEQVRSYATADLS